MIAALIGAMLTPALMIAVCASLIISTSNRQTRTVDRIRFLNQILLEKGELLHPAIIDNYSKQIDLYEWRRRRIRRAMIANYIALFLFLLSALAMMVSVLFPAVEFLPLVFIGLGFITLIYKITVLLQETNKRYETTTLDIENVRRNVRLNRYRTTEEE